MARVLDMVYVPGRQERGSAPRTKARIVEDSEHMTAIEHEMPEVKAPIREILRASEAVDGNRTPERTRPSSTLGTTRDTPWNVAAAPRLGHSQSLFFKLSAELRLMIYQYYFHDYRERDRSVELSPGVRQADRCDCHANVFPEKTPYDYLPREDQQRTPSNRVTIHSLLNDSLIRTCAAIRHEAIAELLRSHYLSFDSRPKASFQVELMESLGLANAVQKLHIGFAKIMICPGLSSDREVKLLRAILITFANVRELSISFSLLQWNRHFRFNGAEKLDWGRGCDLAICRKERLEKVSFWFCTCEMRPFGGEAEDMLTNALVKRERMLRRGFERNGREVVLERVHVCPVRSGEAFLPDL